jgi:hypothetical protein
MSTASDKPGVDVSSDDDDSEEEFVDNLPVNLGKGPSCGIPRKSVSAEVFGKFNLEKEYKPPVHKKSEK